MASLVPMVELSCKAPGKAAASPRDLATQRTEQDKRQTCRACRMKGQPPCRYCCTTAQEQAVHWRKALPTRHCCAKPPLSWPLQHPQL